jgi:excisionase family DNA binding protein
MTAALPGDHDLKSGGPLRLLTTSEVADLLRCSEKTILRRVQAGTLAAVREGGRYVFDAEVIRAMFLANMVKPPGISTNVFQDKASHREVLISDDYSL